MTGSKYTFNHRTLFIYLLFKSSIQNSFTCSHSFDVVVYVFVAFLREISLVKFLRNLNGGESKSSMLHLRIFLSRSLKIIHRMVF